MGIGSAWNKTSASDSKLNIMTVISGTGAELAALNKSRHKLVVCTSTGSGLTVDHVYLANNAGDAFIDITQSIAHTHSADDDGGSLVFIYQGNPKTCDLWLTKTDDLKKAQWIETVTSTGSIEDNTDGTTGERAIRLRTNATSGATATISYPHLKLGFASSALYKAKLRMETFSSIAVNTGVGADDTSAAASNTRKFAAELCTTTNNNWWLRTANGSANTASDTGIAGTANRVSIKILHRMDLGTPEDDLTIDSGTTLQKTSTIAFDNATADNNLIKHSVKNNTAADRPLLVYGSRLAYEISDNWV